jgi:hypothetical protein
MASKKRYYYIKEGHEIHRVKGRDAEGNRIVEVFHYGKEYPTHTKEFGGKKTTYVSAGNKILLTHDELISKKYWRDVIITNSVEREDTQKTLNRAYVDGREILLKDKARQLGLKEADEIVEKYIGGDVVLQH